MEANKKKQLEGDCEEWMGDYRIWYAKYQETGGNPGSPPPPPPPVEPE